MREFILVFGLIASIGITFVYRSTNQTETLKTQNSNSINLSKITISSEDQKIISSLFDQNIQSSLLFKNIINFQLTLNQTITSLNANEYIAIANQNIVTLFNNLNHSLDVGDQQNRTLKLNLLARHLEVIKYSLQSAPSLSKNVNWNIVRQSSGLKNESSELLAHDLLRNYDLKNNGNLYLLEISKTYRGKAKAHFFVSISEALLKSERPVFLNTLKYSFEHDDYQTTVSPILISLKEMKLDHQEIVVVTKSLCHFQKNSETWNDIKKILNLFKIDQQILCS